MLSLRPFRWEDVDLVFAWRNDPFVIRHSRLRQQVGRDEHRRWWERALRDPNYLLYAIELDGQPVGQVRLERRGGDAEISVYLLESFTGRGLGVAAIAQGCALAGQTWPGLARVIASVRVDNRPGMSAFRRAGFIAGPPDADGLCVMVLAGAGAMPAQGDARSA